MDNKKSKKTHFCNLCNFSTNRKAEYVRHINTQKHKNAEISMDNKMDNKKHQKAQSQTWSCSCGKTYKFQKILRKGEGFLKKKKMSNYTTLL